jgi:hypothetical protein
VHSLTTRARAQAYHAQHLRATLAPPRPQPARTLSDRQRLWLARFLAVLMLAILGAALWPDGQTRPLSYSQPEPVEVAGSQGFNL